MQGRVGAQARAPRKRLVGGESGGPWRQHTVMEPTRVSRLGRAPVPRAKRPRARMKHNTSLALTRMRVWGVRGRGDGVGEGRLARWEE